MTAQERYTDALNQIRVLAEAIANAADLADTDCEGDWGYAGTASYCVAQLAEIKTALSSLNTAR